MSGYLKAAIAAALYAYTDAKLGLYNDRRMGRGALAADIDAKIREWRGKTSIHETFLDTVRSHPDHTAFVFGGQSWTWKQAEIGECKRERGLALASFVQKTRIGIEAFLQSAVVQARGEEGLHKCHEARVQCSPLTLQENYT